MAAGRDLTHLWSLFNCNHSCGGSLPSYLEALFLQDFLEFGYWTSDTTASDNCLWLRWMQLKTTTKDASCLRLKQGDWNHKNPQEFALTDKSCCGIKDGKLWILLKIIFLQRALQNSLHMKKTPHFLPVRHETHYGLLYYTNPG